MNARGVGIGQQQLIEQRDGRVGVDGVVVAHHRLHPLQVDGAVDVEALAPAVGTHLMVFAALDQP